MVKLNLGCENEYIPGWINLDFDKSSKADVYWDLNQFPYPFKDNTFDEILASCVLEHLDDMPRTMKELYRIGKQNCMIYIETPHFSNPFRHAEFEHKNAFSWFSFGEWFTNKEIYHLFEVVKKKLTFTRINYKFMNKILNGIINLHPVVYERLFSYILPCSDIVYILKVRKDEEFAKEKIEYMRKKGDFQVDNLKFIKEI